MAAKPSEDFGETCSYSLKERLSAEVTRVTPVGNWRGKRLGSQMLGQICGVVTTGVPPPLTLIAACWGLS